MAYEYGFLSTAAAASSWYFDMLATTNDVSLREMHLMTNAATASSLLLFRTTANGTRTTPTVPTGAANGLNPATNNPLAGVATAWSVNPTNAAQPMRRFNAAASIGAGIIWTWYGAAGPLIVPAGKTIALFNAGAAAGSALNVTLVWDE